jgi:hypothetical protein
MKYINNKEKVMKYINDYIKPTLVVKDLDYNKVIAGIASDLGISSLVVKNSIDDEINAGNIGEQHLLTLSKKDIPKFYEFLNKREDTIKQADNEMKKIEGLVKEDKK